MITIQELLFNRGLKPSDKAKLVRQKDKRIDLYDLYLNDKETFLAYQSQQNDNRFVGLDYIVSFIGEEGSLSRFIGVYKIISVRKFDTPQKDTIAGGENLYEYKMEEMPGFEDLKERVIINWGKSTLSWAQFIDNKKEIVEIQPGLHYEKFRDYFNFVLTFGQLKEIISNGYPDWKKPLSITKGIYLITDTSTGKLYVGSAYGVDGIWGRWSEYIKTNGHGGNKSLKELIETDKNYCKNFNFSILMLLPMTMTNREVIEKEKLFKKKLGANSFGLNNN